jgi:hypothetical protein
MRKCYRAAARYDVQVSFLNGAHTFAYSTTEAQAFPHALKSLNALDLGPLQSWGEYININSVLDALGVVLEYQGDEVAWFAFSPKPSPEKIRLFNGTTVEACHVEPLQYTFE